ncbi:MAG: C40 family peptidase [Bacteroidales bacterium]|nr:C40 family peptidase [Bacteroidales bacterium]
MKLLLTILSLLAAPLIKAEPGVCAQKAFGVISISVANMRATDDYDAEMVSQALLGTPVEVLEISSKNDWPKVRTPDGYVGWVHKDAITLMDEEGLRAWNAAPKAVVTALSGLVRERAGRNSSTVSDLAGGDRLRLEGRLGAWLKVSFPDGRAGYVHKNEAVPESLWKKNLRTDADAIIATALSMKGFPYVWGGMSPKGMDCSGFVRTVLCMHGIIIPRDASQQAPCGERIDIVRSDGSIDISPLQKGDLLFFGRRDSGRVSHVAIYISGGRFIHSLGLVKIGSMDPAAADFDAYNVGRLLFATRFLPLVGVDERLKFMDSLPICQ